jgi:hypothetical protein
MRRCRAFTQRTRLTGETRHPLGAADRTPIQDPPLGIEPFMELIDQGLYRNVSGSINHAGTSTTAVLLVFGPDQDEVDGVRDRLTAALLDFIRWQQTTVLPSDGR